MRSRRYGHVIEKTRTSRDGAILYIHQRSAIGTVACRLGTLPIGFSQNEECSFWYTVKVSVKASCLELSQLCSEVLSLSSFRGSFRRHHEELRTKTDGGI